MESRVTTVVRYARGDPTSSSSIAAQRRYASWTMSSASAALPSMRCDPEEHGTQLDERRYVCHLQTACGTLQLSEKP